MGHWLPRKGIVCARRGGSTPEFRHEAVELYRNSDKTLEQVAKELGIGQDAAAAMALQARLSCQAGGSANGR